MNFNNMKIKESILYYLICLYIICIPLNINNIKIKGISIIDGFLVLIILMYLIKLIVFKKAKKTFIKIFKDFFMNPLTIFMIILFVIMFMSKKWALEKDIALRESMRFFSYLIMIFIFRCEVISEKQINGIIKSLIVSVIFPCIYGAIQFFTGIGLEERFISSGIIKYRIHGGMGNPNTLGAFLILYLFPIFLLFINEKNRKNKKIYCFLWIIIFINIVMTFSRNAWTGLFIGSIVLVISYSRKLLIPFGGISALGLLIPKIRGRVMQFLDYSQNETRYKLWGCATKIIGRDPLKGVGNGNFPRFYNIYANDYHEYIIYGYEQGKRWDSHNSYIKILSELGIIGIVPFIGILISAFFRIRWIIVNGQNKLYKNFYIGFFASLIAFFVMNIFDNLFFVPKITIYFWLILALSESVINLEKMKTNI